ncbi:MAG: fatty acid desaturase family protein [Candidatus Methylomirabilales bacterium]
MPAIQQTEQFSLSEARQIVKDLFAPNPFIYWVDFLFHIMLGWCSFVLTLGLPNVSLWQLPFYLITALALYRAVIFTHELAHLKNTTFKVFRVVWNLTCGFPLMVPSFTYHGVHNDHHRRDIYGTKNDGEYLPFAVESPYKIVLYLLLVFVLPLLFAGRFIILTPLSYLHKKIRRFAWERASSLTIDLNYRRPAPSLRDGKSWQLQEWLTFLYGTTVILLVAIDILPFKVLVLWYLVAVLVFLLNSLRTLAAHRYRNPGDYIMEFSEQYLDSVNIPGNVFLTPLWAPVGLRYHATHHLFPSLPYHGLGKAHRRLVRELSDNRVYLKTLRKGLWHALRELWQEASLARLTGATQSVTTEARS